MAVDSISDIDELQEVAGTAGLECSEATDTDEQVLNFKAIRACSEGHVMAVWSSATEMGTGLPGLTVILQQLATEEGTDIHARLGQGWVIFRHSMDDDPHELGGVRTTFLASGNADEMASALDSSVQDLPEEDGPEEDHRDKRRTRGVDRGVGLTSPPARTDQPSPWGRTAIGPWLCPAPTVRTSWTTAS